MFLVSFSSLFGEKKEMIPSQILVEFVLGVNLDSIILAAGLISRDLGSPLEDFSGGPFFEFVS